METALLELYHVLALLPPATLDDILDVLYLRIGNTKTLELGAFAKSTCNFFAKRTVADVSFHVLRADELGAFGI
jgi:hypothetical protein